MTVRTRILLASVAAALVPLALFAYGTRRAVHERLGMQFEARVATAMQGIRHGLDAAAADIDARLEAVSRDIDGSARLRAELLGHVERDVLLDYAAGVMGGLGLDALLLLDEHGTVLSSGHFRNEFDRRAGRIAHLTAGETALLATRRAAGPLLALVRARPLTIGERRLTVVGGVETDSAFLRRLVGPADDALAIELRLPGDDGAAALREAAYVDTLALAFIDDAGGGATGRAQWIVSHTAEPLRAVQRGMDAWLLGTAAGAVLLALLMGSALAARVNRPLEELARRSLRVHLDRQDVTFASRRRDEVGTLSRMLDSMVQRLRANAQELRIAERRATVGDLARQVNHDVRNGLLPIRNVIRHLDEVAREDPAALAATFAERASTLHGGIGYLESLASAYAKLSPHVDRQPCDVNAVVRAVADHAIARQNTRLDLRLAASLPPVLADPVALRRILENLIVNAVESLHDGGTVTVTTAGEPQAGASRAVVTVADTGAGIPAEALDRIFEDFYSTKARGSGLGLSIVRRLVADMGGRITVESEVGRGTTFRIELPGIE